MYNLDPVTCESPSQSSSTLAQFHIRIVVPYSYHVALQPSSMGGYFTGTGKLVPANRPRENPSMRVIFNSEGYLRGQFAGTICGDNLRGRPTHAVQSSTSILLYILVPVPVKYPPMELRELHRRGGGRGRVSPVPVPVKYPPMELGG